MPIEGKPHLSASQINMFCNCPEAWRRRYLENEIIPPGIALIKGKSVHKPAETNFRQKIDTHEDLPVAEFGELAAAAFEAELAGGYQLSAEEESRGDARVLGEAKDSAVAMAIFHGAEQAPDYQPVLVEQTFRIELPGPRDLLGVIDLADTQRRVTDLKTASRKKNQADVDGNLQLTVYAVGHLVVTGEPASELRLDSIVQAKKGLSRDLVTTHRDGADFAALAARINAVTASIEAGIFTPAPPGAWNCSGRGWGYWHSCRDVNSERRAAAEAGE